jgi:uncharacterized protein (TIGR02246 family)
MGIVRRCRSAAHHLRINRRCPDVRSLPTEIDESGKWDNRVLTATLASQLEAGSNATESSTALAVAHELEDAWSDADPEAALPLFADDAVATEPGMRRQGKHNFAGSWIGCGIPSVWEAMHRMQARWTRRAGASLAVTCSGSYLHGDGCDRVGRAARARRTDHVDLLELYARRRGRHGLLYRDASNGGTAREVRGVGRVGALAVVRILTNR